MANPAGHSFSERGTNRLAVAVGPRTRGLFGVCCREMNIIQLHDHKVDQSELKSWRNPHGLQPKYGVFGKCGDTPMLKAQFT